MIGEVLVWGLKWYFLALEHWYLMVKVLRIKFKTPKSNEIEIGEVKGHLALRLNDTCILNRDGLIELLQYVHKVFRVKYLTIIAGNYGFERELELRSLDYKGAVYYNYELAKDGDQFYVNLVDSDSEHLFLLKLKEHVTLSYSENVNTIYSNAIKSFTSFPPIDLLICMTREYNFTRLFPFHLSFTQFYSCPVLADQSYSREAITEGFEKFSKTKQNFGR